MSLRLCEGCDRHVRSTEFSCPFCQAELGVPATPLPAGWSTRTRIVFGAAAVALGTTGGCTMPVYGASPPPGGWVYDVPPEEDAGADAKRDAAPDADASPLSCYDANSAGTYKSGEPALHQNKATAADIDDFFAACLDGAATQATCNAYVGTPAAPLHTATVNCILPSYNPALTQAVMDTLPPAVFIPDVTYGIALNVRTCRALAVSAPAGCAQSYTDSAICVSEACGTCGSDAAIAGCIKEAHRTGCAAYVAEPACAVALARNAATADALCGPATVDNSNSATFKAAYTLVAQAMCGE